MRVSLVVFFALTLISCGGGGGSPTTEFGAGSVTYQITINTSWSAATHPAPFPGNPHLSSFIGATHNVNTKFWEKDKISSAGMEAMAETGATSILASEIDSNISLGDSNTKIIAAGIGLSPGSLTITVKVDSAYPYLTLVSMLAPSPDWFIGVSAYNLMPAGNWVESDTITLYAYDAGTDNGVNYLSDDSDTDPKQKISKITDSPFLVSGNVVAVGEMKITRIK